MIISLKATSPVIAFIFMQIAPFVVEIRFVKVSSIILEMFIFWDPFTLEPSPSAKLLASLIIKSLLSFEMSY